MQNLPVDINLDLRFLYDKKAELNFNENTMIIDGYNLAMKLLKNEEEDPLTKTDILFDKLTLINNEQSNNARIKLLNKKTSNLVQLIRLTRH